MKRVAPLVCTAWLFVTKSGHPHRYHQGIRHRYRCRLYIVTIIGIVTNIAIDVVIDIVIVIDPVIDLVIDINASTIVITVTIVYRYRV